MIDRPHRAFYRIVKTAPPTVADFTSNASKGRVRPEDPDEARLYDGLSVYATESQARRKSRASPMLGRYIAQIVFPAGTFRVERTL